MNTKQLEEMVRNQGAAIETLTTVVNEAVKESTAIRNGLTSLSGMVDHLAKLMGHPDGERLEVTEPFFDELLAMKTKLSELSEAFIGVQQKVEATNKSAPSKRNMTDDDAKEVMNGKWADMEHKEASEAAGLTYAQVYSCRLEYTFKHVHKALKEAGFVNKWAKK